MQSPTLSPSPVKASVVEETEHNAPVEIPYSNGVAASDHEEVTANGECESFQPTTLATDESSNQLRNGPTDTVPEPVEETLRDAEDNGPCVNTEGDSFTVSSLADQQLPMVVIVDTDVSSQAANDGGEGGGGDNTETKERDVITDVKECSMPASDVSDTKDSNDMNSVPMTLSEEPHNVPVENKPSDSVPLDSVAVVETGTAVVVSTLPNLVQRADKQPQIAEDQSYDVKWITRNETKVPLVTQNANGPCPLIAILNVLLLRGQVSLSDGVQVVTGRQLMDYLGDCLFRLTQNLSEEQRPDFEQNVSDVMSILPNLQTGIDVNVRFTGVNDFECTRETIVFDLLNIPLYHGWLVEPENKSVVDAVGSLSYNQLVERILTDKCLEDPERVAKAHIAECFLESTASQLTYHGLCELNAKMKDGELAVLFRNNHFSTLYKHNNELFILVTDQGFLNEPTVVWETLSTIDGDSQFTTANFRTTPPKPAAPITSSHNASPQQQVDNDYMVALALDQEQKQRSASQVEAAALPTLPPSVADLDRQLALQLQREEEQIASASATPECGEPQQNRPSPSDSGSKKKDSKVHVAAKIWFFQFKYSTF